MGSSLLLVLASCALVAPFDDEPTGAVYGDTRSPGVRQDPAAPDPDGLPDDGSDAGDDPDAGPDDPDPVEPPDTDPPGSPDEVDPPDDDVPAEPDPEALCEPYCTSRDACDPDQGGPLCRLTCGCAATGLVRADWIEPIAACAAAAPCDVDDPLTTCAGQQAALGGVSDTARVSHDACVARENELGCPGRFDCPLVQVLQDEIATAVAGCFERGTCDEIRDCGEAVLLGSCME